MLERDVDLKIQAKVLEDAVDRLLLTVGRFLRQTSEVSACQACAASQWSKLTSSGQPGMYIIRAGQAMTEITCQEVVLEVRETPKCHDHLPIVALGEDKFKYLDLDQNILVQHAAGRRCSPMTALFFQAVNSQWYCHMGLLMAVPPPA